MHLLCYRNNEVLSCQIHNTEGQRLKNQVRLGDKKKVPIPITRGDFQDMNTMKFGMNLNNHVGRFVNLLQRCLRSYQNFMHYLNPS